MGGISQPISARIYAVPAAAEAADWITGDPTQQRLVRYAGHVFNSGEEIPYKKTNKQKDCFFFLDLFTIPN